ncbi:MAG: DUF6922 domain-containing protein [Polyangiaceae bacterium]
MEGRKSRGCYIRGMRGLPPEVEARRATLFWDVDSTRLDPEKHEDFILGRVLVEGDWECVRAIRRHVGDEALASFLRRAGERRLDRRTRRFFETVLDLPCEATSSSPSSAPLFSP